MLVVLVVLGKINSKDISLTKSRIFAILSNKEGL